MRKSTKFISAVVALASTLAFTACGSTGASDGPVELSIWGGVQADQGFNKVIEGFEKKNPNVKVKYTRFTNDPTGNAKLDTALMADDSIDMFFTYTPADFERRAKSGIPLDLSTVDSSGLVDKVKDFNLAYEGKYYGIPTSMESFSIVYNKDKLDEMGITIPDDWTWDDFMEIAKKATHEENGKTVYGLAGVWHNIEKQIYGGDAEYTKDGAPNFSDKGWTIKKNYYDMVYKQKSAYPFSQVMARKIFNYESQLLLTGDALMAFYSPWMSRSALNNVEQYPRNFKLAFAPLPKSTWRVCIVVNTTRRLTTGCRSAQSPSIRRKHISSSNMC
ncbi:ABC transporter substrate-binding protein [Bifidobacterium canis]|uniref:ABC transporter, solute-binding protein n=1 Tax=Bifidobacterium canis TaxID=2610880 RepID=A0A7K1J630_9BIFI|nr:extracellular solute-binding protein [Bifidobacterium canis]MUH60128.1 ABC transporter, solute-binding protein [Bifidobacterium canis]